MLTTEWTSIRRRLAVRRRSHRPPWSARKSGHASIVAPAAASVAASFAATVAVGVGVAIARAERERRSDLRHKAEQRAFALAPGEPPAAGLRRIALGQLDLALELLGTSNGSVPDEHAVHETRKALKRLRALMRLLRGRLGEEQFARENAALRDTGRRLAGARDAEVMVATLDALCERHPRRLGRERSLARLRDELEQERRAATARTLGDMTLRAQVLADLQGIRARVTAWPPSGGPPAALYEPGLERLYAQGRARGRRAAAGKGDRGRALHVWRKRVKDLRHAAEILDRRPAAEPHGLAAIARSARGRPKRKAARERELRVLARRADELAELLGEEHDHALLEARVRGCRPGQGPLGKRARRDTLELIRRRRRKLRRRALRRGADLYASKPRRFIKAVRRARADAVTAR